VTRSGRGPRDGGRAVAERSALRPPRAAKRPPTIPVSRARFRRRRLAALVVGLLLLVGLALGARVVLYDMDLFDVENVRVAGTVTIPETDVLAAAAIALGGPLATVDISAVAIRVARVPAVESVQVERSWPHTVVITVTERVPVATVSTAQGVLLVDRAGVVYRGVGDPGLPRLTTAPRSGDPGTIAAVSVLTALPEAVRTRVETVGATVSSPGAPGQVTLRLTEGKEVRWGSADRAEEKGAALTALLTQRGTVYDVTSPDLPTIRR
jgi:cell division protein FtsQ